MTVQPFQKDTGKVTRDFTTSTNGLEDCEEREVVGRAPEAARRGNLRQERSMQCYR